MSGSIYTGIGEEVCWYEKSPFIDSVEGSSEKISSCSSVSIDAIELRVPNSFFSGEAGRFLGGEGGGGLERGGGA